MDKLWTDWIDMENEHQKTWALNYLVRLRKDIVPVGPMSRDEKLDVALRGLTRNDSNELFLLRMRGSWAQEKYRSKLKKKGLTTTSRVISADSKRKLKQLADAEGVSFNTVTEALINHGFSAERIETERHREEKQKLRAQLNNARSEINLLKEELNKYVGKEVQILHKLELNKLQCRVLELESENLALSEEVMRLKAGLVNTDQGDDLLGPDTDRANGDTVAAVQQKTDRSEQKQKPKSEG